MSEATVLYAQADDAGPAENRLAICLTTLSEAEFAALHAAVAPKLYAYAVRSSGDAAAAEDAVQEAFLRAMRPELSFPGEAQLRGYLYRTVDSRLRDRFRTSARRAALHERHPAGEAPAVAPPGEMQGDVAQKFRELTQPQRRLLWLAYVEELTHVEIAAATGVTRGSVKVLLLRARRRFAGMLRQAGLAPQGER